MNCYELIDRIENQELDDDYFYIFNKTKLTNKYEYDEETKDKKIIGYDLHVFLYIYNNKRINEGSLEEVKFFKTKKDAEDYIASVYQSFVFDKLKNAVIIYDTGQKSEIGITRAYRKYTKNILPYYLVVSNKVNAHLEYFNKHFETIQGEHKYIMNSIRKFYDRETKTFNRIIK